ncbi:type IV pilus biogenesis protein EbsA [[Phormidium] sp. ETS-05]|uniref:type IV pilus biogenesis protein EbsA n=1 Tax=[Phormidium] sp. ETS-05 TaxID=222819 RepID=UPI0018EED300|nr:type IV pilus biogenesis protein EbsA [[Phormidium] sp. ETS-05]
MSNSLDQLQPANPREVGLYKPYYQGQRQAILPRAISLYRQGNLEGERKIEGGQNIPFVATWQVSLLPTDQTRCRVQFDNNPELSYEITLSNVDFINFLIDAIAHYKRYHTVDFSKGFYRKLLRMDE